MKKVVVSIVAIIIILCVIGGGIYNFTHRDTTEVSTSTVTARLEDASECTTQKLIYQGAVKLTKGSIPLINKNSFMMTYSATVRAGFDMSKVKVKITGDSIRVTIPKTQIQDISIDPNSLEFYDTTLTIFKPDGKQSAKRALQEAQKDAKAKASSSGLLEAADENAEVLVQGMLMDLSKDYKLVINHK